MSNFTFEHEGDLTALQVARMIETGEFDANPKEESYLDDIIADELDLEGFDAVVDVPVSGMGDNGTWDL